jgi:putative transposase
MTISVDLIDKILTECDNPQELLKEGGFIKQLTKALIERCLEAEMDDHLGYEKHQRSEQNKGNYRNGKTSKTVTGEFGKMSLEVPRDRQSEFEPQLVKKGQTRLEGFDEKVVSLYARGMTVRDIKDQLEDLYGVEVSSGLISNVTDAVIEEVKQWQTRPLDSIYAIVYFDCLVLKVKENQSIINKSLYLALGVNLSGKKELLGMWIAKNEGAKYWLSVLTELQNRGLKDMFIACVDGLTGMVEALETAYPQTKVQLCIVHMVRNSLRYVSYKDRKELAADLKSIYTSVNAEEAELNLVIMAEKWDKTYPVVSKSWKSRWANVIPFFEYPPEIRKVIYTTNTIESMNMTLRKVTRNHRIFPNDEAAFKVVYLALQNITKKWTMPIPNWKQALNRFAIEFPERFPL